MNLKEFFFPFDEVERLRCNKISCFEYIKFITEDSKVKQTNVTLFTEIIKTESIYRSN